jgi:hypothetical protein
MGLTVAEELVFDGKPDLSSNAAALANDVLEDDVVHSSQAGNGGGSGIGNDVVVEGVALQRCSVIRTRCPRYRQAKRGGR